MELILPGHCGSLLPALRLFLPPVYTGVDNAFASLMRVRETGRGQSMVKHTFAMSIRSKAMARLPPFPRPVCFSTQMYSPYLLI